MKLPKFIGNNLVLKVTSLNAVVIGVRLVISVFIQRLLAVTVGEAGIASIGQIRNVMAMLTSTSTLGVFNGIVKYVSEFKANAPELSKMFSTSIIFAFLGSLISGLVLFFGATYFSNALLGSQDFTYIFKILAVIVPFIAVNRMVNAVVSGLSAYKSYASIELISYILSTIIMVVGLYNYSLSGVIIAIAIVPIIQLIVLCVVFGKTLRSYVDFSSVQLHWDYKNKLLAFTLMSFVSTFLINYIELDIRTLVTNKINIEEAGYWTAMTFISKNYMVFATGLFTLYVLPKFASITTETGFKREVINIYKTILPIFGLGMLLVYFIRNWVINIVYPEFIGMEPLFKWQLLGDFVRLCSLVLAHQFLAKRMVKSFIITEIISLGLFYGLTTWFIKSYGTEGVVIAHFVRYIIYFIMVVIVVKIYFNKKKQKETNA